MQKLLNSELQRKSVDEFKGSDKLPVIVVLDNVRSLNNVGSIFRTCDAFLTEAIYLCGITGKPPHKEIQKTALGATESVHWEYFNSTLEAIERLKSENFKILSIEQVRGSYPLDIYKVFKDQRYALVFGNEVRGVEQDVINISDEYLEIPQFGTKHSFNIAISTGIVLWEFYKQLKDR